MYRLYGGVRFPVDRPCLENTAIMDHGCLRMVLEMRRHGIMIDPNHFKTFAVYLKQQEDRITEEVRMMTGYRVNMASPDQMADLLFSRLGIRPKYQMKLVASGKRFIINDKVLESIKELHPVVPMYQDFVEHNKLRTSFAETLPHFADANLRIHGDIKTTRVVTGRLAMSNPNLMGQPTRSELGKMIRQGFIAPPGRMLGHIDLSQAQMRGAAHLSRCMNMLDVFWRKGDIHKTTASMMFRLPIDQLDAYRHRYPAKRVGFGVLFMITGAGLHDQLQANIDEKWDRAQIDDHRAYWSVPKCDETIELWYNQYPEIRDWQNAQITRARRNEMVWSPDGRPRLVPGIRSVHKQIVADAEREAANSPVVMLEVAIMKLAMAEIQDTIHREKWDCKPLCQIHDALLVEGDKNLPEYMDRMATIFENAMPLDAPIKSDWKVTEGSWRDL